MHTSSQTNPLFASPSWFSSKLPWLSCQNNQPTSCPAASARKRTPVQHTSLEEQHHPLPAPRGSPWSPDMPFKHAHWPPFSIPEGGVTRTLCAPSPQHLDIFCPRHPFKRLSNAICSNIDGPGKSQTKGIKSNIVWYPLYVESKNNDKNEFIYKTKRDSDLENELMLTRGEAGEGQIGSFRWQVHITAFEIITNKDLLLWLLFSC